MIKKGVAPQRILMILFLSMLILPNFALLLPEQESLEQRSLAEMPKLSLDSLEAFPEAFDNYYSDHLPAKNALVSLYSRICWNVFNVSADSSIIKGKDGWFFYDSIKKKNMDELADYQHASLYTREELERMATNLMEMQNACHERGIEFYLLIGPNKSTIYGDDYLPAHYQVKIEDRSKREQLVQYLSAHTDISVVDPTQALLEAKQEGLRVYQKTDTHWNQLGAFIAYQELREAQGKEAVPLPSYTPYEMPSGDLARMLAITDIPEELYAVDYGAGAEVREMKREQAGWSEFASDAGNGERLLMYHDSFNILLSPFLNLDYSSSVYTNEYDFDVSVLERENPTVVVWEMVERNLPLLTTLR